ncbi:signal peptide peptidase SppA [Photobacterium aphoticum]|uniref:Signal peptide peptidase SppA n=1 Tax=Photobacterium aphoticum TaxID=754436 RepID=A0A090QXB5_9GAMM|nr:signal peptide peptidase SppA [Photobacterium aphoticum]
MDGPQQNNNVGGDTTAALLRNARFDENVKAVVLRVDSPGGSAFASEVIRNEVDALKAAGKPVVVSMSSVAASGGYWISASADKIMAQPTTITGSIGIFAIMTTFEKGLEKMGVYSDGVGTTRLPVSV